MEEVESVVNHDINLLEVKLAIYVFHQFLRQCSPYILSKEELKPRSSRVPRVLFRGSVASIQNVGSSLYICDSSVLVTLTDVLEKMTLLAKGFAWAHINVVLEKPLLEWFLSADTKKASHFYGARPNVWFAIGEEIQQLFDYTLSLLHLKSEHTFGTVECQDCSLHLSQLCPSKFPLTSVHMVFTDPGDFLLSIGTHLKPGQQLAVAPNELSRSSEKHTLCIAGKPSLYGMGEALDESIIVANLLHHLVIGPLFDDVAVMFNRCICSDNTVDGLQSPIKKVTVKEEFMDIDDSTACSQYDLCAATLTRSSHISSLDPLLPRQLPPENHLLCCGMSSCTGHSSIPIMPLDTDTTCAGWNVCCPKCKAFFRDTLEISGREQLLGHVFMKHKRLASYFTTMIKQTYPDRE